MEIYTLEIKVNKKPYRGGRIAWGEVYKSALNRAAQYWHDSILKKHFGGRNRSEYDYEQRTALYLNVIKKKKGVGAGRFTDLLLRGSSLRQMQADYRITGTSKMSTLRMKAPTYFTNPYTGLLPADARGKVKRITRQPDKVREVTAISKADILSIREQVRLYMQERVRMHLSQGKGL